jgi:hypothetical protein
MKIHDHPLMMLRICLEDEPAKTSMGKLAIGLSKHRVTKIYSQYGEYHKASGLFESIIVESPRDSIWREVFKDLTIRGVLDWMIWLIDTLPTPLRTTGNTELSLINTLHKSLRQAKYPQSSLILFWKRIHESHCHCSTIWILLCTT